MNATLSTAAWETEVHKGTRSTVVRSASALIIVGLSALAATMSLAVATGNEQAAAKLGPLADEEGWAQLTGILAMIAAPAELLGFGVVLSWVVGREFADGTVSGLFGLPVSRARIASAKLAAFSAWAASVAIGLAVAGTVISLALGYGVPDTEETVGLLRLIGVGLLTIFLALPAGWVATLGRGLLPGIAVTSIMITLGQILVVAGTGAWFPVAAPALWVVAPSDVSLIQLALVPVTGGVFALLTTRSWTRLQLDR